MQEREEDRGARRDGPPDTGGAAEKAYAARRASGPAPPTDVAGKRSAGGPANAPVSAPPQDPEAELRAREARLRAYARLLDSAIRLPGGFRIGLDGLVGLIPGVGDLVGAGLSGYLVVAAARLGIPRAVLARMIANVVIESAVGVVPIVGDAFDFVFKANERNVRLLRRELERRDVERGRGIGVPGDGRDGDAS